MSINPYDDLPKDADGNPVSGTIYRPPPGYYDMKDGELCSICGLPIEDIYHRIFDTDRWYHGDCWQAIWDMGRSRWFVHTRSKSPKKREQDWFGRNIKILPALVATIFVVSYFLFKWLVEIFIQV